MKDRMDSRFTVLMLMIGFAVFSRLLTNGLVPNVAPIGALALFSGAYFRDKRLAFLLPVAAMFLSDLIIGFHPTMIFVYAGFLITVALGFTLRSNDSVSIPKVAGVTLLSSVIFFFLTNAGVWMMYDFYPKNASGLLMSLEAGIPFFRNSVLGDYFYVTLFFGVFEWLKSRVPAFNVSLK